MSDPRVKPDPSPSSSSPGAEPNGQEPPAPEGTLREAMAQLRELQAYAQLYLAAKIDRTKLSVRKALVYAVLGVVALFVGAAVLLTAAALLVVGAAQGLAALLAGPTGPRMWAGNLIVGTFLLAAAGAGAWLLVRSLFNSSRARTVKRYERRLQQQRIQLDGTDARQRAEEYVAHHGE